MTIENDVYNIYILTLSEYIYLTRVVSQPIKTLCFYTITGKFINQISQQNDTQHYEISIIQLYLCVIVGIVNGRIIDESEFLNINYGYTAYTALLKNNNDDDDDDDDEDRRENFFIALYDIILSKYKLNTNFNTNYYQQFIFAINGNYKAITNNKYKNKYLKYKQKYIKLKNLKIT